MNTVEFKIIAYATPEQLRMKLLPHYLDRHYPAAESTVYEWAARLCHSFQSNFRDLFTLTNGGFYMAPSEMGRVHVRWYPNGYNDMMGTDAFGITVTLFALCHLAVTTRDYLIIEHFHQLREFATQHVEAANILRAIDHLTCPGLHAGSAPSLGRQRERSCNPHQGNITWTR